MASVTPTHPKCALFSTLLDGRSILLEAQVSVKDFCNSLDFRIKVGVWYIVSSL